MWRLVSLITFTLIYKRFCETDVALQSVTDVPVNSFNVCGARRRSQGIEETDSVPLNSSVVQIQTVAKA